MKMHCGNIYVISVAINFFLKNACLPGRVDQT